MPNCTHLLAAWSLMVAVGCAPDGDTTTVPLVLRPGDTLLDHLSAARLVDHPDSLLSSSVGAAAHGPLVERLVTLPAEGWHATPVELLPPALAAHPRPHGDRGPGVLVPAAPRSRIPRRGAAGARRAARGDPVLGGVRPRGPRLVCGGRRGATQATVELSPEDVGYVDADLVRRILPGAAEIEQLQALGYLGDLGDLGDG